MKKHLLNRNFFIVLASDLLLLCLSLYLAYQVRFDFSVPEYFSGNVLPIVPVMLGVKFACFYFFDLYIGMWRYTSVRDLINVIKAASVSTALIILFVLFRYHLTGFPRSIFLIDWFLTIMFISGNRLSVRLFCQKFVRHAPSAHIAPGRQSADAGTPRPEKKKLIIIGAGNCGEKIYREIADQSESAYKVSGYLDDDPKKIGRKLHGIPVRGVIGDLRFVARKFDIDEALIAIPSATNGEMRRIVEICKQSGLKFKTVPGYGELIDGKVTVNAIREVAYRDLLGRRTVKLDEGMIQGYLRRKRVIVTGAGGSIGSELCRQLSRFDPEQLVLFDQAESPLYEIECDLKGNYPRLDVVSVLGDILDEEFISSIFEAHRPQIVFHAAAYKHVPVLEMQPWKAIENNVSGTVRMAEVSKSFGIERFVLVSTDKAVRPVSVMGASKRIAEMVTLNQNYCNQSRTRFMAVRFGNVVGSVGSVVPLFKKQIESGGPVTVTHPDVTRFFMTIGEACQLILQAGSMGQGGEIFILDMGTPIRIQDMARDLIRLSGLEPDVDIKIEYTGLRPGEKLYEELITEGENILPTPHENILVLKSGLCDLNFLNGHIRKLADYARRQDGEKIRLKLAEIVPEYSPARHPARQYGSTARRYDSTEKFSRYGGASKIPGYLP